jgi:hypothetical protein
MEQDHCVQMIYEWGIQQQKYLWLYELNQFLQPCSLLIVHASSNIIISW